MANQVSLEKALETPQGILGMKNFALHTQVLLMGLFDKNFNLLSCNQKMVSTLHLAQRDNLKLEDIFFINENKKIETYAADSPMSPLVLESRPNRQAYICYFIDLEDSILLLAQTLSVSDLQLAENMSFMTMKLSNLMREISEKNRELSKANIKIEKLINFDPLTGIYNRRYFNEHVEVEFGRAKRYGLSFSIAMCDLDYFKVINDTYGHEGGDKILVFFANLLKEAMRKEDICVRFGGDEFVILMPQVDIDAALIALQRIHEMYTKSDPLGNGVNVAASFGIASYTHQKNWQELMANADEALYRAKEKGRNCVSI